MLVAAVWPVHGRGEMRHGSEGGAGAVAAELAGHLTLLHHTTQGRVQTGYSLACTAGFCTRLFGLRRMLQVLGIAGTASLGVKESAVRIHSPDHFDARGRLDDD